MNFVFSFIFISLLVCKVDATNSEIVTTEIENKTENLLLQDYIKKCEDKVEAACNAGWNSQINLIKMKEISDDLDVTMHPDYINKLNEVCQNNNFLFCANGLEKLAWGLKDTASTVQFKENKLKLKNDLIIEKEDMQSKIEREKLQSELDLYKNKYQIALDAYNENNKYLCQKVFTLNLDLLYCLNFYESNKQDAIKLVKLYEDDCSSKKDLSACEIELKTIIKLKLVNIFSKNLVKLYENICLNKKDFNVCVTGLNAARELGMEADYANGVCNRDPEIDKLSPCQIKIQNFKKIENEVLEKKRQEERYISLGIKAYIGLEVLVVLLILLIRTRCPKCKTNFAFIKRVSISPDEILNSDQAEIPSPDAEVATDPSAVYVCRKCQYVKE